MSASTDGGTRLAWALGAGTLLGLLLTGNIVIRQRQVERDLKELPGSSRQVLYQRTLETLRGPCASPSGPTFDAYCRDQAAFLRRFPECDADCRALAARLAASPSR